MVWGWKKWKSNMRIQKFLICKSVCFCNHNKNTQWEPKKQVGSWFSRGELYRQGMRDMTGMPLTQNQGDFRMEKVAVFEDLVNLFGVWKKNRYLFIHPFFVGNTNLRIAHFTASYVLEDHPRDGRKWLGPPPIDFSHEVRPCKGHLLPFCNWDPILHP